MLLALVPPDGGKAMELAAALHHSRDGGPVSHSALRGLKAASSGEEAGVESHNALRGLKTLPLGMQPEQLPEPPGPQRCDRTVRGTSVGAPLFAVQSLRGFDGVDDTAAKFLLQQALKKKEEEADGGVGEGEAEGGDEEEGGGDSRGAQCWQLCGSCSSCGALHASPGVRGGQKGLR